MSLVEKALGKARSNSQRKAPDTAEAVALASMAIGAAFFFFFKREESGAFKGLTQRSKVAHAGYAFLDNKYYLDALYEGVIVAGIKGPIARASYWVNQNVIDGVVNLVGKTARQTGEFVYNRIDQGIVEVIIGIQQFVR